MSDRLTVEDVGEYLADGYANDDIKCLATQLLDTMRENERLKGAVQYFRSSGYFDKDEQWEKLWRMLSPGLSNKEPSHCSHGVKAEDCCPKCPIPMQATQNPCNEHHWISYHNPDYTDRICEECGILQSQFNASKTSG